MSCGFNVILDIGSSFSSVYALSITSNTLLVGFGLLLLLTTTLLIMTTLIRVSPRNVEQSHH